MPKNSEGAGSLRLANWLYNVAPKDGTAIGTIGRGTGFDPLLGSKGAQFQADKFTWIGSANNEVSVCVAWKTSGITKFEDTIEKELIAPPEKRFNRPSSWLLLNRSLSAS